MSDVTVYRCAGCGGLFAGAVDHRCPTRIWRDQPVPALVRLGVLRLDVNKPSKPTKRTSRTAGSAT